MKYLLNFNEGVEMNNKMWRRTTLTHYYRHDIQNFNMRDLEELSIYFNENQPLIDYGLNYNKVSKKCGSQITRMALNADYYRLLNDDNSFVFWYKIKENKTGYISKNLIIITKNTDDYFLACEICDRGNKGEVSCYICDDLEGLIIFLEDYFSGLIISQ